MTQPLRALLLAAGLGTRLRPITLHTPKCLVPIGGDPLLRRWLRQLDQAGCESVLINTHYLAEAVEAFLTSWQSSTMAIQRVHEPELLGTAGTLLAHQEFFRGATGLLVRAAQELIPAVKTEHIELSQKVGIRSQLFNLQTERLEDDFLCLPGPSSTHVLNAISPAFTASFALADLIIDQALPTLNLG